MSKTTRRTTKINENRFAALERRAEFLRRKIEGRKSANPDRDRLEFVAIRWAIMMTRRYLESGIGVRGSRRMVVEKSDEDTSPSELLRNLESPLARCGRNGVKGFSESRGGEIVEIPEYV